MHRRLIPWLDALAVVVLITWSGSALGQAATFLLGLQGSGTHFPLPSECEPAPFCPSPVVHVDWTGTMHIVTASDADGIYKGGDGLLALDFDSNQVRFTLQNILDSAQFFGSPAPSVTIRDDRVVSVDFSVMLTPGFSLPAPTTVTFAGLSGGFQVPISHRYGATNFGGVLVAIPEPAAWALLLAGASLLALLPRRRFAAELSGTHSLPIRRDPGRPR